MAQRFGHDDMELLERLKKIKEPQSTPSRIESPDDPLLIEAVQRYKAETAPRPPEHWIKSAIRGLVLPGGGYKEEAEMRQQREEKAFNRVIALKTAGMAERQERGAEAERGQRAEMFPLQMESLRGEIAGRKATTAGQTAANKLQEINLKWADSRSAADLGKVISEAEENAANAKKLHQDALHAGDDLAARAAATKASMYGHLIQKMKLDFDKRQYEEVGKAESQSRTDKNAADAAFQKARQATGGVVTMETIPNFIYQLRQGGAEDADIQSILDRFISEGALPPEARRLLGKSWKDLIPDLGNPTDWLKPPGLGKPPGLERTKRPDKHLRIDERTGKIIK